MRYSTKRKIIKGIAITFLTMIILLVSFMPMMGEAMAEEATGGVLDVISEPLTWENLATVGGCAAFVLLFVQVTKRMMDALLPMPTELYAYVIAVITMLAATAFSAGLTVSNGLLTLFNGWLVACAAKRAYDLMAGK